VAKRGKKRRGTAAVPAADPAAGTETPGSPAPPRAPTARTLVAAAAAVVVVGALVAGYRLWRKPPRPNLLLVTIDTLRADHVGVYGRADARTPVLDGLARRGALFRHAESAVPLTGPSHATILTGLYPPAHGTRDNVVFPLAARHKTLAAILKGAGYRTAAFVGAYPVAASFGFGQGFDDYDEGFHQSQVPGEGAERPGNEVADAAVRWLGERKGGGPFFLWTHFYDPHAPYTPPSPFREEFAGRPYDGEIAFADAQVGRVLQALETAGHRDDTVVIVAADHGESLGDHGERTHAVLVYESTLHVPLLMAGPGVPAGRDVSARVGLVDVLPTALGLLGVRAPAGLVGRDLRPAFAERKLPAQGLYAESLFGRLNCRWSSLRVFYDGDWKLIEGAEPELFDLAADPGETTNRAADLERKADLDRMRRSLQAAVRAMAPDGDRARPNPVTAEAEEALRSLGYTAGSGGSGALDEPGLPDPRRLVGVYESLQAAIRAPRGIAAALDEVVALQARDPKNPFAHFAEGSLAYRAGRLREADQALARALELDPDRPNVRQERGRVLRDRGLLEDSERELRIVVEQTRQDVGGAMALADTLLLRGKLDEAGALVEDALLRDPHHQAALGAKGRLLVARGQPRDAVPFLEQAAAGGALDALVELGVAYLEARDPARARESAERVLARAPAHPWALTVVGRSFLQEGRRDEGLRSLRQALAAAPRRIEVWKGLARGFEEAGDAATAARCRREAESLAG
jgi:arylsulfatase A-like enzyme/Tfp pilus assembly protein PilF